MSEGADVITRIGWDNTEAMAGASQLERRIEHMQEHANHLLEHLGEGLSFAGALVGVHGLESTVEKVVEGIKEGFHFNEEMEEAAVGLEHIIMQFERLDEHAAKNKAAEAIEQIKSLEPTTAASMATMVQGLLGTNSAAQHLGVTMEQNVALVSKFANAMANTGLPEGAEALTHELRNILEGNINKRTHLAHMLGITNEDITQAKAAGNVFEYLTGKLGLLAEAGDSSRVVFSSLHSALEEALGTLAKPLFESAVEGAKEFAKALENPALREKLAAAGHDLGELAKEGMAAAHVVLEFAPTLVHLGVKAAGLIPTIAALTAGFYGQKLAMAGLNFIGQTVGIGEVSSALHKETGELHANTAAHEANAAARTAEAVAAAREKLYAGQPVSPAAAQAASVRQGMTAALPAMKNPTKMASIEAAQQNAWRRMAARDIAAVETEWAAWSASSKIPAAAEKVAASSAKNFLGSFGRGLIGMNGVGVIGLSLLREGMMDPSKAIGGEMGSRMADGLSMGLSMMGPAGIVAALGIQAVQAAHQLGEMMGDAIAEKMYGKEIEDAAKPLPGFQEHHDAHHGEDPHEKLLETLAQEEARLKYNKSIEEDIKKVVEEREKAQASAAKTYFSALEKIDDELMKNASSQQQIANLTARYNAELGTLKLSFSSTFNPGPIIKVGNSIEELIALAQRMRNQGDWIRADEILKAVEAMQGFKNKIDEIAKSRAKAEADSNDEADAAQEKTHQAAEEYAMQLAIAAARRAAHGEETQAVKAAEDNLAIYREALSLEEAMQISQKEALELARQKVAAEREANDAAENAQRLNARQDLAGELGVLDLKARGHAKQAEELEKQLKIAREAKSIHEQTGLSEQQSLAIAQKKAELEDRIKKHGKHHGREGTHGYSGPHNEFGGLNEFYNAQRGSHGHRVIPFGHGFDPRAPLAAHAERNKAAAQSDIHATLLSRNNALMEGLRADVQALLAA